MEIEAAGSHKLVITEFMIYNDSIVADEDGDYSDWLEIYNPGTSAIQLLNWILTDNETLPQKWSFPDTIIQPNQYLIVFASGKNRAIAGKELHTNFKLSANDVFLALIDSNGINLSSVFSDIPEQFTNVSYGEFNSAQTYFDVPTPGYANISSSFIPPVLFSVNRGFFTQPFQVILSSSIPGASIRYTKNGSFPTETDGLLYSSPISITTTTPLRAVVYLNGKSSFASSQTYLFLSDVKRQNNTPVGYPSNWGPYTAIPGNALADYEMDPEIINNPLYSGSIDKAFKDIPTLSVITSIDNLFSSGTDPFTGGIYSNTGAPVSEKDVPAPVGTTKITQYDIGYEWGRPASVEYFDETNSNTFFANCRIELHGGHSRRPEKDPKHSFNIEFKGEYGIPKLKNNLFPNTNASKEHDAFVLRAGFNNSWTHVDYSQRKRGMYIHDAWMKDSQLEMGETSAHSKFVHLYLNGIYWGVYSISERLDKDFAEAYFNGKEEDFDIIKDYGEATAGSTDAWNAMMVMASKGLGSDSSYFKIQGKNKDGTDNPAFPSYVSIDNFIDYMLLNFYGGNNDWDHHNWTAIRNRNNPGNGFKFLVWDGERVLEGLNDTVVLKNNLNRPSGLFTSLKQNKEFRLEFADHVQRHLFNNGALTPVKVAERWIRRSSEIQYPIICESARWGDYRRDVHPYGGTNFELCTKANYWDKEQTRLINTYFPQRTAILINQLKYAGLFPSIEAPILSWYGGQFRRDTTVSISAATGTIYYTLNGEDPRKIGGEVSPTAIQYNGTPLHFSDTVTIKARVKSGSNWSAVVRADYFMIFTNPSTNNQSLKFVSPELHVYPNPVGDLAYFVYILPKSGNVEFSLYRADGILISKFYSGLGFQGENRNQLNTSNLIPGIYFYTFTYNNQVITGKLVKTN